jgi:hypothetical protein
MSNESLQKLREAIQERGNRPSREQYDEMIQRGAIDREGNVTIRRPEPPAVIANGLHEEASGDSEGPTVIESESGP